LIINDASRNMYLSISETQLNWGSAVNNINNFIYTGKWIIKPNSLNTKVECQIKLNTLKANDTFMHSLIIIKGKISCSSFNNIYTNSIQAGSRLIQINNNHIKDYSNIIDANWPVSTLHEFTLVAKLAIGTNSLSLDYSYLNEKAQLNINVNYDNKKKTEPLHLVIFLTKDSPKVFDMDPVSKLNQKNDLTSAIKRFQTIASLWQAFNSEILNLNKLGYKSFQIQDQVNIIQSNNVTLANLYKMLDQDIFSMIHSTIRSNAEFMFKKSQFNPLLVATLILDAHWDKSKNKALGHTALGGGSNGIQMGIFGSHLAHAWPESTRELIWRLTDNTPIDMNYVAMDASPTKFKSFNVGSGAFLHEVGHALGLDHTSGIMLRGFEFLNRAFINVEPSFENGNFIATKQNENLGVWSTPEWNANDTIILSNHVCFNEVANKNKILTGQWKINDLHEFLNFDKSDVWYEFSNKTAAFAFKFVKIINNDLVIYDQGRTMYIRISNTKLYWGSTVGNINNSLYDGKWILKPF
jgi:hypothetical protein